MARNAIEIRGVGKRYLTGERSDLTGLLRGRRRNGARLPREEFWALRDIDLDVAEGETIGLIGSNGAGKSTLLKILARIVQPTTGTARVRGRVGALLEVGTAFHPDLTGRENVWVNGALLGMSRRDVAARFDEIVEFSGVAPFIDTPVKRYSSGMFLRLAFAVAAHLEPEVIVVDEVLAVGDAEFQRRCLGKMSELGASGRTIVFVSHDLGAIGRLCRRAVWIERGTIRAEGDTAEVIGAYRGATAEGTLAIDLVPDFADAPIAITRVELLDAERRPMKVVRRGDPLTLRLRVEVRSPELGAEVAVWVTDEQGVRVLDEALHDDGALAGALDAEGTYEVELALPPVLPAGDHVLGLWAGTATGEVYDREVLHLDVAPRLTDPDEMARRRRTVSPHVAWTVRSAGS